MRDDGNILPLPAMTVQKRLIGACEVAAIVVEPADAPPVRYKGRVLVRVGPRRGVASPQEERMLSERRRAADLPFDLRPVAGASVEDLDLRFFVDEYLPSAIAPDVLQANHRDREQQLASLRFLTNPPQRIPTVVGLLTIGLQPVDYLPCAYVQFLRIDGCDLSDPVKNSHEICGPLPQVFREIDEVLRANISTATELTAHTETRRPDYPLVALQQIVRNAVIHRVYEGTNAPVRVTWFGDHVEIDNPGGPFGQVTPETFGQPGITDYRNPHLAEAAKTLGYVQRFGVGIEKARNELARNNNPELEFNIQPNYVLATLRKRAE